MIMKFGTYMIPYALKLLMNSFYDKVHLIVEYTSFFEDVEEKKVEEEEEKEGEVEEEEEEKEETEKEKKEEEEEKEK